MLFCWYPVILRLYLHRETCTPEPGYETGQGGPASCSVQCNAMQCPIVICRGPACAIDEESACVVCSSL
jgi:hypothetical protein